MTKEEAVKILKSCEIVATTCDMKDYTEAMEMSIKALEQEIVLDKIKAEIEQIADEEQKHDEKWAIGLRYAVKIIDKYKAEMRG